MGDVQVGSADGHVQHRRMKRERWGGAPLSLAAWHSHVLRLDAPCFFETRHTVRVRQQSTIDRLMTAEGHTSEHTHPLAARASDTRQTLCPTLHTSSGIVAIIGGKSRL
eukprot:189857-Prymnesium_polylepis.2